MKTKIQEKIERRGFKVTFLKNGVIAEKGSMLVKKDSLTAIWKYLKTPVNM